MLGSEGAGRRRGGRRRASTHLAVGDRVAYAARTPGQLRRGARASTRPRVVKLPDCDRLRDRRRDDAEGPDRPVPAAPHARRRSQPGDTIVWHAAAGGVGLIACQWATALGLAADRHRRLATRSARSRAQHGAAHAIDYRTEDVVARVRELTGGARRQGRLRLGRQGHVGALARLPRAARPDGQLRQRVGPGAAGQPARRCRRRARCTCTRPTLFTHLATRDAAEEMASELFAMVASGKVEIDRRRYPLDDAAQAHRDLEARATTGAASSCVLIDERIATAHRRLRLERPRPASARTRCGRAGRAARRARRGCRRPRGRSGRPSASTARRTRGASGAPSRSTARAPTGSVRPRCSRSRRMRRIRRGCRRRCRRRS